MTIQKLTHPMLKAPETAPMSIQEAVWIDRGRMGGRPCLRNSRIEIIDVLQCLIYGESIHDYIESFLLTIEMPQTIVLTAGQLIHDATRQTLSREPESSKNRNSSQQ